MTHTRPCLARAIHALRWLGCTNIHLAPPLAGRLIDRALAFTWEQHTYSLFAEARARRWVVWNGVPPEPDNYDFDDQDIQSFPVHPEGPNYSLGHAIENALLNLRINP